MHERKRTMFERADAFVALPGGIGTLEELVEQMTWAQLGRHKKPILIANINGFWDPLLRAARAHADAGSSSAPALTRRSAGRRARRGHPAEAAQGGATRAGRGKEMKAAEADRLAHSSAAASSYHERHRLDAVAVGIADEGGVIALAYCGAEAGRAVGGAAGGERRGVKGIDHRAVSRAQADMRAAIGGDRRHIGAMVDPELGIFLADSRSPRRAHLAALAHARAARARAS